MDLRENVFVKYRSELVTQLNSAAFNNPLDHLLSAGILNEEDYSSFLMTHLDTHIQKGNKVRDLLIYMSDRPIKDKLQVFYDSLLQVELTDAAQLIKPYLPDPEKHQVKPQSAELGAISRHPTKPASEPHSIRVNEYQRADSLPVKFNSPIFFI